MASMRPERLSSGNLRRDERQTKWTRANCFNEAGAIKLRKSRPFDMVLITVPHGRFNEAGAIQLRKSECRSGARADQSGFNEAGAIQLRKSGATASTIPRSASMRPERLSSGNLHRVRQPLISPSSFNEAGAIQLRKSPIRTMFEARSSFNEAGAIQLRKSAQYIRSDWPRLNSE